MKKVVSEVVNNGVSRRQFFARTGQLGLASLALSPWLDAGARERSSSTSAAASLGSIELPFAHGERQLAQYPQKRPLALLTSRAVQLETPFSLFNDNIITPNDAFFVRYHYMGFPLSIDDSTFRLNVGGYVNTPLQLSLSDLKTKFNAVDIMAVNQCTGNSRGFVNPRVTGGQWGHGAMGNALWTGVRLRDVLDKAGVRAGAVQVTFAGMDNPSEDDIPKFVKALDVDVARSEDVLLAYAMNGEDIPMLNGYPLKLVVPGYWGTYWVKQVNSIQVRNKPYTGFWMAGAYQEPDNQCACVEPGTSATSTRPVSKFLVRSFITSLQDGAQIIAGQMVELRGVAFDSGSGIKNVEVSQDGGSSWTEADLVGKLGRYAFQQWRLPFMPSKPGDYTLKVRATANSGETQPEKQQWNPAGYHYNVIETVRVTALS